MAARTHSRHQPAFPALSALVGLLLILVAGCDGGRGTEQPAKHTAGQSGDASALADPTTIDQRVSCPLGRPRGWTLEDPTTVPGGVTRVAYMRPAQLIVDRVGTATVSYGPAGQVTRTADDPPAKGDPQALTGGVEQGRAYVGDNLAMDAVGTQTLAYLDSQDFAEAGGDIADVVLVDRPLGGTWSATPTRVEERVVSRVDLDVNSDGAAAAIWIENPRDYVVRLRAVYRPSAGAPWSKPQRVPVRQSLTFDATIDDAGRVLIAYDRSLANIDGIFATRRTLAGKWSRPQLLSRGAGLPDGAGHRLFRVVMNPDGAAVVVHRPVDGNFAFTSHVNTSRMRPDGTWQAPQPQPHRLGLNGLAIDDRGRVLLGGWDHHTFRGRWGHPDGSWGEPFTIAAGLGITGHPRIAMNGRGDAVATWATKADSRTPVVWARFKPAGRRWTPPMQLTPRNAPPPLVLQSAVGDCGHAAFTWTTPVKPRKLHIRRAIPTR
jgi:hypothetical protein